MMTSPTDLELNPNAGPLASSVTSVWARFTGDSARDLNPRVPPDGCADIIWIDELPPIVVGPTARFLMPTLPPHALLSGVRIRPGAVASMLGSPASELRDRSLPLADLWPAGDSRRWSAVSADASTQARITLMVQLLTQRVGVAPPPDPLVGAATARLERHPHAQVDSLSVELGIGPRQLRRRFEFAVGYGPKTFQRVMRLQSWIRLLQSSRVSLATSALEAGYADQAHLTREVSALMGIAPAAFLASSTHRNP